MQGDPMVRPGADMNSAIRRMGQRGRSLPDIGQGDVPPMTPQSAPQPLVPQQTAPSPMAAPDPTKVGNPFVIHPPGTPADPSHYNYEPQAGGAWKVYPPGVPAPPNAFQASMPRAASTPDYARMSQALGRAMGQGRGY